MSLDIFKKELKAGNIRNVYIFFGPEKYLVRYYISIIKEFVLKSRLMEFNYLMLEGENAAVETIIEFCESLPVMSDKKLLIIKQPSFLKSSKTKGSGDLGKLIEYLGNLPEYLHVIFVEGEEIDKRNSLYNFVKNSGLVVEFPLQSREQLSSWIKRVFKENGKIIGENEIYYLIENIDPYMQSILNECMKIIGFVGDKQEVSKKDIDLICTRTLNSQVFEMIDSIAQKNLSDAVKKLSEMVTLKEPLVKVLVLIARHIRILLQVKLGLCQGLPESVICQKAEIKFISKYVKQSANFTVEKLEEVLRLCSSADIELKTTNCDEKMVIEKLIVKIAQ